MIGIKKGLVILTRHVDVDIIIPGDIALVAHSTNQGAATEELPQAVSLAEAMHLIEDAHLNLSQFLNIVNSFHSSDHFPHTTFHY